MSGHPIPPCSLPELAAPTSSWRVGGCVPLTVSHCHLPQELSQVLEGGDLGKGDSVGSDNPLCPLLCLLLLHQETPLPLHSPYVECYCQMLVVKGLLWRKHVTMRSPGVGAVTFFQYHNCTMNVAVRNVNPKVGLTWYPTQAPRYQAPEPQ